MKILSFISKLSTIVWVNVVLKRTVVVDSAVTDISTICAVVIFIFDSNLSQFCRSQVEPITRNGSL